MDKQTESRKAFELWAKSEGMDVTRGIAKGYISTRYIDADTYLAWEWWQKSRDSLVVELPQKISEFNRMAHNGVVTLEAVNYDEAIDDCADALRAIGIRIKGEGV